MTDAIDRSLDDIVSEKYQKRNAERRQQRDNRSGVSSRGRGNFRGRGGSYSRGGYNTGKNNYSQPRSGPLYTSNYRSNANNNNNNSYGGPTKLLLSNLDPGVSPKDVRELYSEFGQTDRIQLNYDRSGRSQGTAEILYQNKADAIRALKTYNGVPLDGRPMVLEIVGGGGSGGSRRPVPNNNYQSGDYEISYAASKGGNNYVDHDKPYGEGQNVYNKGPRYNNNNNYRGNNNFRGGRGQSRGRGRGGYNNNNNRTNNNEKPTTEEDLDKQLDSYLSKRPL